MNDFAPSGGAESAAALGGVLFIVFFYLALVVLLVVAYFKLIGKTGNSPWLALLLLVPLANLGLILWLAFSEWPIERELRYLRSQRAYGAPPQDSWNMPPRGG